MGGTAVGTGRGDQLNPALAKGRFDWVVVPSDVGLSTPEVYQHLDVLREQSATDPLPWDIGAGRTPEVDPGVLHALRAGDAVALAEHVRNDLQAAALSLRPELRDTLELGEHSGALVGMVSGSGPSLAFLTADPESALDLQVMLSAAGLTALHVHGPVTGARVLGS
jgi:4-diphosphocytidyl-2-C-methyl-D-erythritol kinase